MARSKKYLTLVDTDISVVIETLYSVEKCITSEEFKNYIKEYNQYDLKKYKYDKDELLYFVNTLREYIETKKNKLRVKTELKLNNSKLSQNIFGKFELSIASRYQIYLILDYINCKYEIHDHVENIEENYKKMYDDYIDEQNRSIN